MNKIIVTKEDLHFGGDGFTQGIYERVRQRIDKRNITIGKLGLPPIGHTQERNMLIGEIGEVAFRKDVLSRGATVLDDSWTQFSTNNGFETVVDLAVHDGLRTINYQVKSSEAGRRSIEFGKLKKCIESPLHFIAFVAVRARYAKDGDISFECVITSQMAPRHIPQLATWKKDNNGFVHVENAAFIKDWLANSKNYRHKGKRTR